MSQSFRKFLTISLVFHLAVFLFFVFAGDIFGLIPRKPSKVTYIRLSRGTGENPTPSPYKNSKDMPESTIRERKEALKDVKKDKKGKEKKSAEAPKKPQPKKPVVSKKEKTSDKGAINPTPTKKTVEDKTIDDALARIQQQMESRKVENEVAQAKEEGTGQSPQGAIDVTGGEVDAALLAYSNEILKRVQQQWITIPKTVPDGQVLKTVVSLMIDSQGNLQSTDYETKSGDISFDLSAMRAVERAAPFPAPPDAIKDVVLDGISIGFNPQSVVGGSF